MTNLEVRLALEVGQRLVDDYTNPDPILDTDIFRQIVGSTMEILYKFVQHIPAESRPQYGKLVWADLGHVKSYSLAEWVDMDETQFWQTFRKQLPLLVKTAKTINQKEQG